jgi:uncharacterized OsmC-like protein
MSANHVRPPIVVTHEGGVRFAAQVRSHRVLVDQPHRAGGDDSAPSPIELLGAALGTCVAYYVQQFCSTRGLPYDGLRVEVEQRPASSPARTGRFVVHVSVPPHTPPQYVPLIERVARSCPAHNTLSLGAEVSITIGADEPEGALEGAPAGA